jgi:hypothetical protein
MRRSLLMLGALAALAGLAAAIVAVATSSASGTPGGSALGVPSRTGGHAVQHVPTPPCSLGSVPGPSAVAVRGVCSGKLTGEFRCARTSESFALSISRPLNGGNVFYLTILVADFTGPGGYPESEGFAQVIGPAIPPRWTRRDAITRVNADGTVELGVFRFAPEVGTPATGRFTLTGHAVCAEAERGLVAPHR